MFTEIYGEALAVARQLTRGDPLAAAGLAAWAVLGGGALLGAIAIIMALEPVR